MDSEYYDYVVYDYNGQKMYEEKTNSVVAIYPKGLLLDIAGEYKFVSYDGSSGKSISNGLLKYAEIKNFESTYSHPLRYYNYGFKDIYNSTVCYPYIQNDNNQYCILSDEGDVIVDFGLIDNIDNIKLMANADGICFKVGSDVY